MMAVIPKVQRQFKYCEMKAPAMGPTGGPSMALKKTKLVALPLVSGGNKSAIVPPPITIGTEATHPWKNRRTTSRGKFHEIPASTVKYTKPALVHWYSGRRP